MVIKASNSEFNSGATQRVKYRGESTNMLPSRIFSAAEGPSISVCRSVYRNNVSESDDNERCYSRRRQWNFRPLGDPAWLPFESLNNFDHAEGLLRKILTLDDVSILCSRWMMLEPEGHRMGFCRNYKTCRFHRKFPIPKVDLSVFQTCHELFDLRRKCTIDKACTWKLVHKLELLRNSSWFSSLMLQIADVVVTEYRPSVSSYPTPVRVWSAYDDYKRSNMAENEVFHKQSATAMENKGIIPPRKRPSTRGIQRPASWAKSSPSKSKSRKNKSNTSQRSQSPVLERPREVIHINTVIPATRDARDLNVNFVCKRLGHQPYNAPRRSANKRKCIRRRTRWCLQEDIREGRSMVQSRGEVRDVLEEMEDDFSHGIGFQDIDDLSDGIQEGRSMMQSIGEVSFLSDQFEIEDELDYQTGFRDIHDLSDVDTNELGDSNNTGNSLKVTDSVPHASRNISIDLTDVTEYPKTDNTSAARDVFDLSIKEDFYSSAAYTVNIAELCLQARLKSRSVQRRKNRCDGLRCDFKSETSHSKPAQGSECHNDAVSRTPDPDAAVSDRFEILAYDTMVKGTVCELTTELVDDWMVVS